MDAREELARILHGNSGEGHDPFDTLYLAPYLDDADAILAAGYRKMPDREGVESAIDAIEDRAFDAGCDCGNYRIDADALADAILALMDGNK